MWMAVGSSSGLLGDEHASGSEQVNLAAQEQARELEWGSALPSPRRASGFAQRRPTQPCRVWQPLLFPTPLPTMQKVSGNGLLWFCAQKVDIRFLLSLLLIAFIKWL